VNRKAEFEVALKIDQAVCLATRSGKSFAAHGIDQSLGSRNGIEFKAVAGAEICEVENDLFHGVVDIFERRCDGESFSSLEEGKKNPSLSWLSAFLDKTEFPPRLGGSPCSRFPNFAGVFVGVVCFGINFNGARIRTVDGLVVTVEVDVNSYVLEMSCQVELSAAFYDAFKFGRSDEFGEDIGQQACDFILRKSNVAMGIRKFSREFGKAKASGFLLGRDGDLHSVATWTAVFLVESTETGSGGQQSCDELAVAFRWTVTRSKKGEGISEPSRDISRCVRCFPFALGIERFLSSGLEAKQGISFS
jgi:hypothetical protein